MITASYLSYGRGESLNSLASKASGRFPRTVAAKKLNLSLAAFDAGRRACGYIATEWHHTGKYANKTVFFDTGKLAADYRFWEGAASAYKSQAVRSEILAVALSRKGEGREERISEFKKMLKRNMVVPAPWSGSGRKHKSKHDRAADAVKKFEALTAAPFKSARDLERRADRSLSGPPVDPVDLAAARAYVVAVCREYGWDGKLSRDIAARNECLSGAVLDAAVAAAIGRVDDAAKQVRVEAARDAAIRDSLLAAGWVVSPKDAKKFLKNGVMVRQNLYTKQWERFENSRCVAIAETHEGVTA